MFEPTRLAAEHLADAYGQVVPIGQRLVQQRRPSSELAIDSRTTASVLRRQS